MTRRLNIQDIQQKKEAGEKLVMATAYDYTLARLADEAGVDMLLVGDSLGVLALGYDSTVPVTMEDMLYHTRPVARGSKRALIVADLPFGAYQLGSEQALHNALQLIQAGAGMVKMEGGRELAPLFQYLKTRGIPAMAHIGLLPQTADLWDGFHTHGQDEDSAWALVEAAQALEEAGAAALMAECVTSEVGRLITERLDIPVIGVGSGVDCDGQMLRSHDLLGLTEEGSPHYVRHFVEGGQLLSEGLRNFCAAVRGGAFPAEEHSYPMEKDEAKRLY